MVYVDLNPVRAGLATTPESSDFTSVQDRTAACQARRQLAAAPTEPTPAQDSLIAHARTEARRDQWLVPFATPVTDVTAAQAERPEVRGAPATFLGDMSAESYFELLDWTGRQLRAGKRGYIPPHIRPALDRLDLKVEAWVENVEGYGSLFHRLVGRANRLRELAGSLGCSWLHGQAGARRLYTTQAA
jgi:hypothetical protein